MITIAKLLCILGVRHEWQKMDHGRKRRCLLCEKRQKLAGSNKPYLRWVDEK